MTLLLLRCIYNALASLKPEVEAGIKMGRKLVETQAVAQPDQTSQDIDRLKELFNVLGAQVRITNINPPVRSFGYLPRFFHVLVLFCKTPV